jgi:type I restriction enzyme, S subunit
MEKLIPKLRFPEFKGEWEKKKLGEVAEISSGGTPSRSNPEYWNGNIPWVSTTLIDFNFINKTDEYITEEGLKKSSAKLFPKGTLLMAMYGQGKTRGKISILNIEATTNQACGAIITNSEKLYSLFAFQNLANRYDEIRDLSNQGGQENLSGGIIKGIEINYPTLPEQQKIATFLTSVDEKLQAFNKKKSLLEIYKKGVMQKIFSQELRFKDENGNDFPEWEEKTLGEVCKIKRGASPRPITDKIWFDINSKIGWVRISDVSKSNKFLNFTEQYLSEAGVSKSRFVEKGNMIMSICATLGKPIYTNIDVCIPDSFIVFENLTLEKEYLFYYLDFIQLNWYKYGQPGTQVNLNSDIVSNEILPVPCNIEQTRIANFLTSIDGKINHCSEQIAKMEVWKKGLLQGMFC